LHYAGIVLSGGLIVLWVITRLLPAPFHAGPETVDLVGEAAKVVEAVSLAALIVLLLAKTGTGEEQDARWYKLANALLLAAILGFGSYSAGMAAERMLPWPALWGVSVSQDHSHDHSDGPAYNHGRMENNATTMIMDTTIKLYWALSQSRYRRTE
jgi:hypothetical protein